MNVLVNNAAAAPANVSEESDETWDRVMRVNLTACFLTCRAAWPHLIQPVAARSSTYPAWRRCPA